MVNIQYHLDVMKKIIQNNLKYLKEYNSDKFSKENLDTLKSMDIITSFIEDLSDIGFKNISSLFLDTDLNCHVRYLGSENPIRNIHDMYNFVSNNINSPIKNIEYTIYAKGYVHAKKVEPIIDEFLEKMKELSENCKIINFRFNSESNYTLQNTKNELLKTANKNEVVISSQLFDSAKTRYKNSFTSAKIKY
jgi:hypothetical protein